jgi:outer membrane lipoprotein SlyB
MALLQLSRAGTLFVIGLLLSACATQGQSRYSYQDVGRASVVEFGTVISSRPVEIKGQNTGAGAAVGGTAAGLAVASGTDSGVAVLGAAVAGAVVGAALEQSMADRFGLEYIITLANGKTITLVQEQVKGDRIFAPGDRVMVQANGTYQRVLPADHLPTEITRPKDIKVVD